MLEPIIERGIRRSYREVDEEGILVEDVSWKPMRDEVTHKGDVRAVDYSRWEDPRLEFEIKGPLKKDAMGQAFGLGNVHPGAAYDCLNVADGRDIHGFEIDDDNTTIIGNPTRDSSAASGVSVTIPGVYRPYIAKPVIPA